MQVEEGVILSTEAKGRTLQLTRLTPHAKAVGHFRITFGLFFKASPGAHLFI